MVKNIYNYSNEFSTKDLQKNQICLFSNSLILYHGVHGCVI